MKTFIIQSVVMAGSFASFTLLALAGMGAL
jgi:hypothetical protein